MKAKDTENAENAEKVLYTLEEYQQMAKIHPGRVAGIVVWKGANLEPKERKDWDKEFDKFLKRKIT